MSEIANMPYRKRLQELNLVFYLQSFVKVTAHSSILWPEKSKMSWQGAKSLRRHSYSLQMKKSWRLKFRAWKSRESYEKVEQSSLSAKTPSWICLRSKANQRKNIPLQSLKLSLDCIKMSCQYSNFMRKSNSFFFFFSLSLFFFFFISLKRIHLNQILSGGIYLHLEY